MASVDQAPSSQGILVKPSTNSSKTLYQTRSPFEKKIGYYRGVRHGSHIFISGTTAVDPSSSSSAPQIQYPGDAKLQTRVAFEECIRAVEGLDGSWDSVVRVRMFVSRHEDCEGVGEVFREMFAREDGDGYGDGSGDVGTAATMIVVRGGFVNPDMLVEVEVDAMVS